MTALTAQGQPKDIKEQIRNMVGAYISQQRTIILMVCPARADLEADPAVELAREHDPRGERTVGTSAGGSIRRPLWDPSLWDPRPIPATLLGPCRARAHPEARRSITTAWPAGVMTKVDLMNAGTDISRYLQNAVPTDLQLHHGCARALAGPASGSRPPLPPARSSLPPSGNGMHHN